MLLNNYKEEQFGDSIKTGAGESWKDFNVCYQNDSRMGSRKEPERPTPTLFEKSSLSDLLDSIFDYDPRRK